MNKANMLSAQKVKMHGMTSKKWTTKDQITQYKGLISLYTRDKKIIEMDNTLSRKRQAKELQKLQGEINGNRKTLDNAIKGDKQKLRNTLAEHKELQLMFQNSGPQEVIDMVHQVNFTKRKNRDMLSYRMKLKSENLIDLKLKCAEYEDIIPTDGATQSMLPCEKQAHLITGKVQDAILRKEAAIYIRNSYKQMIAIMKKDAIYFDSVLLTLKTDGMRQGKCMINATKLGQQAAEYLDDRRSEFNFLEKIVKNDMFNRKRDLALVQENVESFTENLKQLMRRDSDSNLGVIKLETSGSYTLLEKEVCTIEDTFKILEKAFITPSVDQLYPLLREQLSQKERLRKLMKKSEFIKDDLLMKTKHANSMRSELENSVIDTTVMYNTTKVELKLKIKEQVKARMNLQILIDSRYETLAQVRISLKHLQSLSRLLSTGELEKATVVRRMTMPAVKPEEDEIDGLRIIPELTSKFTTLANSSKDLLTDEELDKGYKLFEILMRDRSKLHEVGAKASEESLIETVFLDPRVPTYEEIKKQSEDIVLHALEQLAYVPPPPVKKKKFKF